jgi:hypothetical protein
MIVQDPPADLTTTISTAKAMSSAVAATMTMSNTGGGPSPGDSTAAPSTPKTEVRLLRALYRSNIVGGVVTSRITRAVARVCLWVARASVHAHASRLRCSSRAHISCWCVPRPGPSVVSVRCPRQRSASGDTSRTPGRSARSAALTGTGRSVASNASGSSTMRDELERLKERNAILEMKVRQRATVSALCRPRGWSSRRADASLTVCLCVRACACVCLCVCVYVCAACS